WLTGLRRTRSEWDSLRRALAPLYIAGWPVRFEGWDTARRARVALPTYPFERRSHWVEGTAAPARENEAPAAPAFEISWQELPPAAPRAERATVWVVCGGRAADTMAEIAAGLRTRGAVV